MYGAKYIGLSCPPPNHLCLEPGSLTVKCTESRRGLISQGLQFAKTESVVKTSFADGFRSILPRNQIAGERHAEQVEGLVGHSPLVSMMEDPDPAKAEQDKRWRELRKLQNERTSETSRPD